MTVWKDKDRSAWRYRFFYKGRRYKGSTGQLTREDAEEFEEDLKRKIRRAEHGLQVLPEHTPTITLWAEEYFDYIRRRGKVRRLNAVDDLVRVVLRFWGAKPSGANPKNPPIEGEPYHDLRLADPIHDPGWIERFEDWIRARGSSPQTRLHYMSILSRMYRVAMLPKYAKRTGIQSNPFLTVERDRPAGRQVTLTPAQLRAWLSAAPRHTQLAMAIAALAPKLRLANVLALRWDQHIDAKHEFIRVEDHKTVGMTGQPLVVPITPQLRKILQAAKREASGPYVITYRGEPVRSIRTGLKEAAKTADLLYGRDVGGVTFHTIRHTAATLLAEVPSLTEAQRAATMGQDIQTTQRYTHLRPASQRPVLARLGSKLRLSELLDEAFAAGTKPGTARSETAKNVKKFARSRKAAS